MANEQQEDLDKYIKVIKTEDRCSEEAYEQRLEVCRQCEMLLEATCLACGCYVEIRAAVAHSKCPKKRW